MTAPRVSVAIATWNRGAHILPTLRSVQGQTMAAFECLVIGDAVTDRTGRIVAGLRDRRFRWINLARRWGSQSGPNNRALHEARGAVLAYLGHDDIWAPDHLSTLLAVHEARPDLDLVASGLLVHTPRRDRGPRLVGLVDETTAFDDAAFVPPTALSHKMQPGLPHWPRREAVDIPVDRAFQAAMLDGTRRLGSTGRITAHKWTGAARYLEYLEPCSGPQAEMLSAFTRPDYPGRLAAWQRQAWCGPMPAGPSPDRNARLDRQRGLILPDIVPLDRRLRIEQDDGPRALDWRPPAGRSVFRWCGPNHRPRLLVPVTGDRARLSLRTRVRADRGWPVTRVLANDSPVDARWILRGTPAEALLAGELVLAMRLRRDRPSILTFELPPDTFAPAGDTRRNGFAAGPMILEPLRDGGFSSRARTVMSRLPWRRARRK